MLKTTKKIHAINAIARASFIKASTPPKIEHPKIIRAGFPRPTSHALKEGVDKESVEAFEETKIATKFGEFNFRVYAGPPGKETVALWADKLDPASPVLVRVHSECMTGDMFGSLHCDCGKQLEKSLQMIQHEGGLLIYLRQEGRGIGLFEKIKTYQLQRKGYDTFEANVILGHKPDERTYEMVKTILDDLNIKRIRLLTNNPSKVSEVSKLGIVVVERVPLIMRSNKFNRRYFTTKRDKFKHQFTKEAHHYFYQFHADSAKQVREIASFLGGEKRDPFLKICVGVSANTSTFANEKEKARIASIFKSCDLHDDILPILHFSFIHSIDILKDLKAIKKHFPYVQRIQLNDLSSTKLHYLQFACNLFSVDLPLSDENFKVIHKRKFRNLIKKHEVFILLDNSKGRGLKEPKESLRKKIDLLLNHGINDIGIFGGFGPNELETYCDLRRYYRINFSIDAETKLKTNGKVDVEKTKLYLQQLIRFDDPKQDSIEQTRTFLTEHRRNEWDKAIVENKEFLIHPAVFHAGYFPSTAWFASAIRKIIKNDTHFCEVGCGSGVISCLAALSNPKLHVVATDINPFASKNTKINAKRLGLRDRIKVANGDVLDAISKKDKFDTIFWALPFGYLDPGTNITLEEAQVFDPGYRAIRKFLESARNYLKPGGKLLIGFSSDLGHQELLSDLAKEFHLKLSKADEKLMKETTSVNFELLMGTYEFKSLSQNLKNDKKISSKIVRLNVISDEVIKAKRGLTKVRR